QEEVFLHGWSHGSTGDKLKGKKLLVSLTTGAPEGAYTVQDGKGHDIDEYLLPLKVTCGFTGMEYCGKVCTYGVSYQLRSNPEQLENIKKLAAEHAERLAQAVADL
ncbi:MAG: NAD(P)H-dependent oxidoreductase, partial [Desulfovibrionaceae bacterium]|nr:NAD(P)H-dependent oxidoreductase [Desulfovibrionaceae bacterium]